MVSAVERFAQVIPLNIQEIFLWYFEQKGVDNPERFLAQGVNGVNGVNNDRITPPQPSPSGEGVLADSLQTQSEGNSLNPENQLSNLLPQNLPLSAEGILSLLKLVYEYASKKGGKTSELEKLIESMEEIVEEE